MRKEEITREQYLAMARIHAAHRVNKELDEQDCPYLDIEDPDEELLEECGVVCTNPWGCHTYRHLRGRRVQQKCPDFCLGCKHYDSTISSVDEECRECQECDGRTDCPPTNYRPEHTFSKEPDTPTTVCYFCSKEILCMVCEHLDACKRWGKGPCLCENCNDELKAQATQED